MSKEIFNISKIDNSISIYNFKSGNYEKIRTLGSGNFGKVLLVKKLTSKNLADSINFALKINRRIELNTGKENQGINEPKKEKDKNVKKNKEITDIELVEMSNLKKLSHHPNIVNIIDINFSNEESWILMEYVPTDLRKFFWKNKNNKKYMNERFFKSIAYQIICGVNFIHSELVVHRDLKPENIFYDDKNNIVKIGDFGLSVNLDFNPESDYLSAGTYPYMPPDVILGLKKYGNTFDIWSVGCVLFEICTASRLIDCKPDDTAEVVLQLMYNIFGSFNDNILPGYKSFPSSYYLNNLKETKGIGLNNLIKEKKKFEFENDNFFDLIGKMLCINPTKRISAKDCLSHPWFDDLKNEL